MGLAKGPSGLVLRPSPGWGADQNDHSTRRMLGLVSVRARAPGPLLV